jgi:TPR repeat protein
MSLITVDYEVAYSNAAYLIRRRLAEKPSFWASIYSASAKLVQSIQQYRESKDSRGLSTTVSNETAVHGESDSGDVFHASQLLRTLLNAARKGNVDAYSGVGDVFYKGSYVRFDGASDYSRALSWYEKAASRGVSVSHLNIAFMHQFGLGVPVNLIRAQQMYEKVIQKASSDASNELYSMPITIFSKAMLLWVKKSQKSPLTFAAINSIARKLVQSWHQHK